MPRSQNWISWGFCPVSVVGDCWKNALKYKTEDFLRPSCTISKAFFLISILGLLLVTTTGMSQTPTEQNIPQIFCVIPFNLFPFIKGRHSEVCSSLLLRHSSSSEICKIILEMNSIGNRTTKAFPPVAHCPSRNLQSLVHFKCFTQSMDLIRGVAYQQVAFHANTTQPYRKPLLILLQTNIFS